MTKIKLTKKQIELLYAMLSYAVEHTEDVAIEADIQVSKKEFIKLESDIYSQILKQESDNAKN